jgi:hypothetical protein
VLWAAVSGAVHPAMKQGNRYIPRSS